MASTQVLDLATMPTDGRKKNKKRVRVFTSNDRALHRTIEKQRREALNQSFLDLARQIPNLAPVHRLSKSLIVKEGVDYLRAQREMRLAAANEVRELLADYDTLVVELNNWRAICNPGGVQERQARPVKTALLDLLKVDQEKLGTFPGGFGDKGTGDEHEEDPDGMSDGRGHCDGDIEIPNANLSAFFSESNSVDPTRQVETDPLFWQSVPIPGNDVSLGSYHSNISQSLPTGEPDTISVMTSNLRSSAILDEGLFGFMDDQNILQHQTLPADPGLSVLDTSQLPYTNVSSQSFQHNPPGIERINHQYLPDGTESQPNFHTGATNQLSLTYGTTPNYLIHDMAT